MASYIAELPTIFRQFYWCSQYHKHFYRGRGWGSWDSRVTKSMQRLHENWKQPNNISWCQFVLHITQTAKSMLVFWEIQFWKFSLKQVDIKTRRCKYYTLNIMIMYLKLHKLSWIRINKICKNMITTKWTNIPYSKNCYWQKIQTYLITWPAFLAVNNG